MRRICGVVLAAGGSTRLGRSKQLVQIDGETLVHAAVRSANEGGCDAVYVVTGHARAEVELAVTDLAPVFVHNEEWHRGMGSSVRHGVGAIGPASAVLLLTCDQPGVNAKVVGEMIRRYDASGVAIVAAHYSGTLGVPAIFDACCFGELLQLPDSSGAKQVIHRDPTRVDPFRFPAGACDLDTLRDIAEWESRTLAERQGEVSAITSSARS